MATTLGCGRWSYTVITKIHSQHDACRMQLLQADARVHPHESGNNSTFDMRRVCARASERCTFGKHANSCSITITRSNAMKVWTMDDGRYSEVWTMVWMSCCGLGECPSYIAITKMIHSHLFERTSSDSTCNLPCDTHDTLAHNLSDARSAYNAITKIHSRRCSSMIPPFLCSMCLPMLAEASV